MGSDQYHIKDLATAAEVIPPDQPVFILNLIRFHKQAQYPPDSQHEPCSGQEAMMVRYAPEFRKVHESLGLDVSPLFVGPMHARIVPGVSATEKWDVIALVHYPDFKAFRVIVENETYLRVAQPHRLAAVEHMEMFATTQFGG